MPDDPFVAALEEWIEVSTTRSMHHFLRYVRKSGFSLSHMGTLMHLHKAGTCGVTELGDHLDVSSAAASQMLERLVQQGLILRSVDPHDRRVKQIVITDEGNRILEEGIRARQSWLDHLGETLSAGEKETIMQALVILIDKVKYLEEPLEAVQ